ncbi:MAG: gliding motility protein RemB, partial [Flavobacterium sp.]|nr:gliding motility protein RemB [Flavobacterium sp.]
MKQYIVLLLIANFAASNAQVTAISSFPRFPECSTYDASALETCFYNQVQDFVYNNFKIPSELSDYKGSVFVLFEVDATGVFKVLYVDANEVSLMEETRRVFATFPKIEPAVYNGRPTYAKYTIRIAVPLQTATEAAAAREQEAASEPFAEKIKRERDLESPEYDGIVYKTFENPQFKSNLYIPFSHSYYAQFDDAMNQVGTNSHTSSKPFTYNDVNRYHDFAAVHKELSKEKSGWWGRKLWNENLIAIQGEGYWFTMNPIFDL